MKALIALLVVALLAIGAYKVGGFTDDTASIDERAYCKNVHDKVWPDYKEAYAETCNPDGTVKEH